MWLGSQQMTLSQYYLKARSDSISLENDSVMLFIDNYRGIIDWQASSDLVNWVSLNKSNDTLALRIDSSAYYRARIIEGSCSPVMSDTAFLIEKVTVTGSNQFTVDGKGGVFLLPSGIKVKILKGAVIEPKTVRLETLSSDSINSLAAINGADYASFLSGISMATDMFDFKKPIKIRIPVKNIGDTSIPALYELQGENKTWLFSDETMIVSSEDKFIEILLKASDQKSSLRKGVTEFTLNDIRNFFLKKWGDIFWSGDPCRKAGGFWVETRDIDNATGEGCTGVQVQEDIAFYGCDPPQKDAYVARVLSPECEPELKNSPVGKIKKGESGTITLTTEIGGFPLSDQEIQLSTTGNLSISKPLIFTGGNGNVSFNVTGIEAGYGTISASVSFDYYLTTSFVYHNGKNEYYEKDHTTLKQDYGINVTVYDKPVVTTSSPTNMKCTSATVGGNVIDEKYDPVTERGIEIDGGKHPTGSGIGAFSIDLTGLDCNTEHTARAYATNLAGTGYGATITFKTLKVEECLIVESEIIDSTCTKFIVETNVTLVDNTLEITECGVYHGFSPDPRLTGTKVAATSGPIPFKAIFEGLPNNITYYMQAYAKTGNCTAYGKEISYNGQQVIGTVTDIDGNIYRTVKIGDQVWMAENLKTTRWNSGSTIPLAKDTTEWKNLYNFDENGPHSYPGMCWHGYHDVLKNIWGGYYSFKAVGDDLCPSGWHIPSEEDFIKLNQYLDSTCTDTYAGCRSSEISGSKLQATEYWSYPNFTGTDEVCFTALPGGYVDVFGKFIGAFWTANFWTSRYLNTYTLESWLIAPRFDQTRSESDYISGTNLGYNVNNGLNVRCVKNIPVLKYKEEEYPDSFDQKNNIIIKIR